MFRILIILIRIVISALLAVISCRYAYVYNLHMFQLNGYKNAEHIHWIGKHIRRQWVLIAAMVLGLLTILLPGAVTDAVCLLWFLLCIAVYQALCGMSQKKPLVYTARVKRLTVTSICLDLLFMAGGVLLWDRSEGLMSAASSGAKPFFRLLFLKVFYGGYETLARLDGALLILSGLNIIICVIACIVNTPVEKGVNLHFINDAKRILKSNPDLTVIGVTGSYGKTSVKYYLGELLSVRYNVCITPESFNTPMGVVRTVRERMKPGTEIFVCEMGARHVGDIKELCDLVHPDHGIITSIGPQHLETFYTMDNIVSTKFELGDAVPPGGLLFLNGDNEYIRQHASGYGHPVMYYAEYDGGSSEGAVTGDGDRLNENSPDRAAGYRAVDITLTPRGTSFTVVTPDGERETYGMSLIGAHNIINVTGAIAVAHKMGIPLKDLRIPVRRLRSVPHRLELKRHGSLNIIDDAYNSNPVGAKAALDTLNLFDGMKIIITPGMVELGEREEEYNTQFGRQAAQVCDYILTVGRARGEIIKRGALDMIGSGVSGGGSQSPSRETEDTVRCSSDHIRVFDHFEDAYDYAVSIPCDGDKYILLENDLPDNY